MEDWRRKGEQPSFSPFLVPVCDIFLTTPVSPLEPQLPPHHPSSMIIDDSGQALTSGKTTTPSYPGLRVIASSFCCQSLDRLTISLWPLISCIIIVNPNIKSSLLLRKGVLSDFFNEPQLIQLLRDIHIRNQNFPCHALVYKCFSTVDAQE